MAQTCPLCNQTNAFPFFQSTLELSVLSDWTPVPAPVEIWYCDKCGHLYKSAETTGRWSNYDDYRAFHNVAHVDKINFDTSLSIRRTDAIRNYLELQGVLSGPVLDYGCNRGNFLKLLGEGHAGFDISNDYKTEIENLGCTYYTQKNPPPKAYFSLLSLIHVAEHLTSVPDAMAHGLNALKNDGLILIQVPDVTKQPIDFYVMDHCSHFCEATLNRTMAAVNLKPFVEPFSLLGGEFTALYQRGNQKKHQTAKWSRCPEQIRTILEHGEQTLHKLKQQSGPFWLYGAGYLGSMVTAFLGDRVQGLIDDNSLLQGKKLHGRQVISFSEATQAHGTIIITVPPVFTNRVSNLCKARNIEHITLFHFN